MFQVRGEHAQAMGTVLQATLPDRLVTSLQSKGLKAEKDPASGAVVMTDARGFKTRLNFLDDGLPASTVFPSGARIDLAHDDVGKLSALTYPNGERVDLEHDRRGRLSGISHEGGCVYRFEHDDDGRLQQVTYPDESATRFVYGAQGLEQLIDRKGAITTYASDERAGRHTIKDPLGRSTTFATGARGKLERIVFADGTAHEYQRDDGGALLAVARRDGSAVQYERDANGELQALVWPDQSRTYLWQDKKSGAFGLENAADTFRVSRDERRQPVREETSAGEVGYDYDEDGRLIRIRTPWNDAVSYAYDCDGRLERVTGWDGQVARFEHSALGAVQTVFLGNRTIERRDHGRLGITTSATVSDSDGQILSEQHYHYDSCDRLIERSDAWGPEANEVDRRRFVYDAESRILAEIHPINERVLREYDYDAKGNLTYDDGKRIVVGPMDEPICHDEREIAYDGQGNAVRLPSRDGGELRCVWAADGTLEAVWANDIQVRFAYDPLGRRISKKVGRSTWRYGWAAGLLLWEEWQTHPTMPAVRRDYMYLPDGTPLAFREGGKTFWLQTDARGAVIRAFDDGGNVVWRARYDSFGAAHVEVALVRQPLRLAGQYEDEETGLHYNFARYYCPWLKSYISLDPHWFCFGATNYSYARNDPWNKVDPGGGLVFLVALGVIALGGLVGAAINATFAYLGHGNVLAAAVGGFIEGAFTTAGAIVGSVVPGLGTFAGGLVGGAIGSFFGTLVEGAISGQGWCWECALRAAATSIIVDLLTLGLGKLPIVKAILEKAGTYVDDVLKKAKPYIDDVVKKARGHLDDALKKADELADNALKKADELVDNALKKADEVVDDVLKKLKPDIDVPPPKPDVDAPTQNPKPDADAPEPKPQGDAAQPNPKPAYDSTNQYLDSATPYKTGKVNQYRKPGGFDQANADFDGLVKPESIKDHGGGIRSGITNDGSTISVRPNSTEGAPTVQINPPSGKPTKVRYD